MRILETLGLKFSGLVRFTDDGSESRLYVLESLDHDSPAAHLPGETRCR
jgi:hypothetical protein